ncbi:MAG: histidine--tRNA ligase [Candidatus Aenigmatarchaeota archaeon]
MAFQPPKGTRDFLPNDMKRRRWLFDIGRRVFDKYGFEEVVTPAFESMELLTAKGVIGDASVKDIYRFEDKSGRKLGLRFDLTAPIARIVAANRGLAKPLKWCYNFAPVWRYEDVTKGRYREFYQSGVEVIGSSEPVADATVVKLVIDYLLAIGISDFVIRVNSRKVLDLLCDKLKISKEKQESVLRIIDKLEKQGKDTVEKELSNYISNEQIKSLLNFMEMNLDEAKNYLNANTLDVENVLNCIFGYYRKYIQFAPSIARGLDYYNGFIFEVIINKYKELGSVAGGGRYDNLIELYGGPKTPATGVGIGVERLLEVIEKENLYEKAIEKTKAMFVYIAPVSAFERPKAFELEDVLRSNGFNCETDLLVRGLSQQLRYASSRGADIVLILGKKDLDVGAVTLRDMKDGSELKVELKNLVDVLKKQ